MATPDHLDFTKIFNDFTGAQLSFYNSIVAKIRTKGILKTETLY